MIIRYLTVVGLFLLVLPSCNPASKPTDPLPDIPEPIIVIKSESPPVSQPLPEEEQSRGPGQTDTVTSQNKPKPIVAQTGDDATPSEVPKLPTQGTVPTDTSDPLLSKPEAVSTAASDALTSKPETASGAASQTPSSVSVDPSKPPSVGPIPPLKGETGTTKFTVKQLVDSGLLGEGGSNAYYSYVTYTLNQADKDLKQSARGKAATDLFFLCNGDIPGCVENGLTLEQLNKPMIMRLIHVAGHNPSKFYKTEDGEAFFVLQGEQVTQDFIEDAMERMKQAGSNKILVNLPQIWNDLNWFFYFGSQLKEEQIVLHIVGQCGSLCAKYSIPAAHKVVMEPYGHIGYNGSFSGLLQDMETVYSTQVENSKRQFYQKHFSQNEVKGLVDFFDRYSSNLQVLMLFEQSPIGNMLNQLSQIFSENRVSSFWDLSREGKTTLLSNIRQEVRDILKSLFFELSGSTKDITNYYTFIQNVASAEADYYKKIQIIPESKKGHTYLDFVNLTARLIKNMSYAQLFYLPRPYYNIPEKDKPYVVVFPSADILRQFINIQGENNTEVLHTLYEDSENIFLFLSVDDMENCDFFAKGVSFTTDTLHTCLSQDGSLL